MEELKHDGFQLPPSLVFPSLVPRSSHELEFYFVESKKIKKFYISNKSSIFEVLQELRKEYLGKLKYYRGTSSFWRSVYHFKICKYTIRIQICDLLISLCKIPKFNFRKKSLELGSVVDSCLKQGNVQQLDIYVRAVIENSPKLSFYESFS